MTVIALLFMLTACHDRTETVNSNMDVRKLSYDEAVKEAEAYYEDISPETRDAKLDTDMGSTTTVALADLSTFPITTRANAEVVVEIAADTELSDENAPDNWANLVAAAFNQRKLTLSDGRTVGVNIRKIVGGETVTYMVEGNYRPDAFIPSHAAWGEMLESRGFKSHNIVDKLVGNTAGILMKRNVYDAYVAKHGKVTVGGVMEAALNHDLISAVTNPYTSSTGLNMLAQMLYALDPENPLSERATQKLIAYQQVAPVAAYSTAVMRESAKKGIVDAMAMEAQAYVLNKELSDYIYTPVGFRHDHPVIVFDYVSAEKEEVLKMFVDYCLEPEQQKLATEKGFNLYEEYAGQDDNLAGGDYFSAQRVWKKNKNGGRPVIAVFVADVSTSMKGDRLRSLRQSLLNTIQYIDSDNYIGLVSYNENVYINLPIRKFDDDQRSHFSGAVKELQSGGCTATYSATAVGLKMLLDAKKEVPNAQLMLFVLTDGVTNRGRTLSEIAPMVAALDVPIYTIAYETTATDELMKLSSLNEAACISATVDVIVNELRSLFNISL